MFEREGLTQLPSYYLWALSLLSPTPQGRLLDISCGRGVLLQVARDRGLCSYGVDLSDRAVRETNARLGATLAVVADAESLPFPDRAFEFVANLGSVEHYLRPERGIVEMARVLSAEGKALVLVPNSYSLLENIWQVFLSGDVGDQGQPMERYATRAQWEQLLADNGLSVRRTVRYNLTVPRTWSDLWWYVQRPRKLLWLLASLFVPLNLSGCFAFLCDRGGESVVE